MKAILKLLKEPWCLFVHGFLKDKHKMYKPYGPFKCEICGRYWECL
jgi:hypothetical protein